MLHFRATMSSTKQPGRPYVGHPHTAPLCIRHKATLQVFIRTPCSLHDFRNSNVVAASESSGFVGAQTSGGRILTATWHGGDEVPSSAEQAEQEAAAEQVPAVAVQKPTVVADYVKLWVGLGLLYATDYFSKKAFIQAGIKFPNALAGMFVITAVLVAMGEKNAGRIRAFFAPALDWIAKWLPLFYVATLVVLPLSIKGLSGDVMVKIAAIVASGMVATLLFTAQTAAFIRSLVNTATKEVPKSKPASPFVTSHYIAWGAIALVSLACVAAAPSGLGASMALPFTVSCTVFGYLMGSNVPHHFHAILPPVIVTGIVANMGAALCGSLMGAGYDASLKMYCAKGLGPMGAGDLLLSFLGSVILSMGFRIYDQRETMKRHAPEILGATLLSAIFSFVSTAFAARAIGLESEIARALLPRSVTVALAMPIASQLDAPMSITASAVMLSGLLGANLAAALMNMFGIRDTIARGLAMAAAAHGLGTAAMVSKEPEALPFCALSYSMVGIFSTLLASIPQFRAMLVSIVG